MKIYLTKYALTKGIIEVDEEIDDKEECRYTIDNGWLYRVSKKDYSLTKDGAIQQCEEKRIKKLKNLKKQFKKISSIKFC